MQINDYLKNRQPVIYQTFKNALLNDNLSHAYLLVGPQGSPLLESAKFLAKSILCEEPTPYACEHCITCERIENDNYPDLIVFDGSSDKIKKTQVEEIEASFNKEAFEEKGIKIYILHLIENMTVQAVNAILKFLEEPGKKIYAFLTTNNESIILPTIISRCQTLHLKNLPREDVIELAINLGVEKEDAELLSYFYNDEDLIKDASENDKNYEIAKECLHSFCASFDGAKHNIVFTMEHDIIPSLNNKESLKYFLNMLIEIFEDLQNLKYQKRPILSTFAEFLIQIGGKIKKIDDIIIELLKANNTLYLNVNSALLLDHIILMIVKEISND